jgi:predicted phosphodiesterase
MTRVRTAVVSDLHLGILADADVAREGAPQAALVEAVADADRLVLLGDLIELRERPLAEALEVARPLLESLGRAMAGRRIVLLPGNHDHAFAEPWLARLRLDGEPLPSEAEWPVGSEDGAAGRIAAWMPDCEITLAYPGVWLRPDVYATHGHYLDLHLTVPRLESIAASAMGRLTKLGKTAQSASDYETILGPMYAFYGGLAQGATAAALARGGSFSRVVWQRASDGRAPDTRAAALPSTADDTAARPGGTADAGLPGAAPAGAAVTPAGGEPAPAAAPGGARAARERAAAAAMRFLLGRVTIPGAVAALNVLGLGPFRATLTGEELRRSGLLAMARVADALAPDAEHVIFGHTHRPGPLPRDDRAEWATPSGTRLWNSGSWLYEGPFVRSGPDSPYWPGTVVELVDDDEPRIHNVLSG